MSLTNAKHRGREFSVLAIPSSNIFKLEITNHKGSNAERLYKNRFGVNVYGGSHLIEHLGFKASRDYSTEDLMQELKQNGSYNANTSYERINYYYLTSMDNWKLGVDLITNVTFNDFSKITEEEFSKEKDVVYNEVKRYNDDAQTMYHFNVAKTLYGYEDEDTVLGSTESVEALKLEDLKHLKGMFLNEVDHTYAITYDPKHNLDEILDYISDVVDSYKLSDSFEYEDEYRGWIANSFDLEHTEIQAQTEQTMVSYVYEEFASPYLADFITSYVSSFAPNISLTDYIREKNGLTYGISMYTSNDNGKFNLMFSCDVTEGNEELLLSLYKQSIKECSETFNEDIFGKFIDKKRLNTSISMLDKKVMMGYSKDMFTRPNHWGEISEFFEGDASEAPYKIIDSMTYEKCKKYIDDLHELTSSDKFKIIKGHKDANL